VKTQCWKNVYVLTQAIHNYSLVLSVYKTQAIHNYSLVLSVYKYLEDPNANGLATNTADLIVLAHCFPICYAFLIESIYFIFIFCIFYDNFK